MPVSDIQEYLDVQEIVEDFFEAPSDQAVHQLQELMVEKLDFTSINQTISLVGPPAGVELPNDATAIARFQGVTAIYLPLVSRRVRKWDVDAALRVIGNQISGELLLIASNLSQSPEGPNQLHFIFPSESGSRTTLRRIVIERDLPMRTAVQQLALVYKNTSSGKSITESLEDAFSVERVTREFFRDYREVFEQIERKTSGFDRNEAEDRKLFVQTLMNRLMFIQFLARKGWMKFNGDADYLNALWADYQRVRREESGTEQKNFLQHRLNPLFTKALNNPNCRDLLRNNPALKALVGDVHFLNGGLFDDLDGFDERVFKGGITVDDSGIELILRTRPGNHGLFNLYNFTVLESTPWDVEVAVDPEMLGKVFEELVTGRHESGSYYTPRPVVSFMCREALKGYLNGENTGASAEAIRKFVDQHDRSDIGLDARPAVSAALRKVSVVDPACGSGAYLLGMLRELVDLQQVLLGDVEGDSPDEVYGLKLHIIETNLYGADIDRFAVNIAMLRLWLSLSVDYDGDAPQPLPNLDFKLLCGDSLTAPAPSPQQFLLGRDEIESRADELAMLKVSHIHSTGDKKKEISNQIAVRETELRSLVDVANDFSDSADWRVSFAEIFSHQRGFDIVLANPPYVSAMEYSRSGDPNKRQAFRTIYESARGAYDLFVPFFERGLQILNDRGVLVYISPNKWLSATYASSLRRMIRSKHSLRTVLDISHLSVFDQVSVYPVISVIDKNGPSETPVRCLINPQGVESIGDFDEEMFTETFCPSTRLDLLPGNVWGFLLSEHGDLIERLLDQASPLGTLGEVSALSTAAESEVLGGTIRPTDCENCMKLVKTGSIAPYVSLWGQNPITHSRTRHLTPYIDVGQASIRRRRMYRSEKIIIAKMARRGRAFLDAEGQYAGIDVIGFLNPQPRISLHYVLAFLNSSIFHFLYSELFGALHMAGGYMQFEAPQLRAVPVRPPTLAQLQSVEGLAKQIIESTNRGVEIDQLEVYLARLDDNLFDVYELADDEADVIRRFGAGG